MTGLFLSYMPFADTYLLKQQDIWAAQCYNPADNPQLIVVIPCYNEPDIVSPLQSLAACTPPSYEVEVIVVVNAPEHASGDAIEQNKRSVREMQAFAKTEDSFGLSVIDAPGLPHKFAGAGLARKIGMDTAIEKFNCNDNEKGVVVSLDADCSVASNYFTAIDDYFEDHPATIAATIYFEHPLGVLADERLKKGITLYELYMRYYRHALMYTGFPYSTYTIGSAFAVRAEAYIKQGGMNRRKAGEDFYFLQKLVSLGEIGEIKKTTVYPSARLSDRVPFGTGPVLQKWMNGDEVLATTYSFSAFDALRQLFVRVGRLYKINKENYGHVLDELPEQVGTFLISDKFFDGLDNLNQNCSTPEVFQKRFFHLFNAFKVLKYLNYSRELFHASGQLAENSRELLEQIVPGGVVIESDPEALLRLFRQLDRG